MKWFKHEANARRDIKLRKLHNRYGMAGYGLYWYCLEQIVENVELHNLTFELEHDAEILAMDTGINIEILQQMIMYMVELQLFEDSGGTITCLKLAKRLDQSMTSNPKMREKIKVINNLMPDKIMTESGQSHDGVMTESCKKRIEEKRIEENKGAKARFRPPTMDEVTAYAKDKGWVIDADKFWNHYESKGWMVGRNKMKSWKAAVSNSREWTEKKNASTKLTRDEQQFGRRAI